MFKIYNAREQLWQWDVGQRLIVSDKIPCSEVHFCNGTTECSLTCEMYEEDGLRLVDVPNILLQEAKTIKVFAYVCDDDDHHTEITKYFFVTARPKPAGYVYTETEVKNFATLEKRIKDLEENGAGVNENDVREIVDNYLEENPISDVTSNSIKTALGYTPADAEDVGSLSEDVGSLSEAIENLQKTSDEEIALLIETDMLPAVHDTEGRILTDENGNVILRY